MLKWLLLLTLFSGCADFSSTDRSYLNHPAMNFDQRLTDDPTSAFTTLTGGGGQQNAGCSTCAK